MSDYTDRGYLIRMAFPVLRFMLALKAARDWGLPDHEADAIALRLDPREPCSEHLVDALAERLIVSGAVTTPDFA